MLNVLRIGKKGVVDNIACSSTEAVSEWTEPTYFMSNHSHCQECIRIDAGTQSMDVLWESAVKKVWIGTVVPVSECDPDLAVCRVDCDIGEDGKLIRINTLCGRCPRSMEWLDEQHRAYIHKRHRFKKRSVAIRAVAGSGKTTTLLTLAKRFKAEKAQRTDWANKRILYVAFNKQLIDDIKLKLCKHQLTTVLCPMTFDALIKRAAELVFQKKNQPFHLIGSLTPHTLSDHLPWFKNKPFAVKKTVIKDFATFCQHPTATHPAELYGSDKKKMVQQLWQDTLKGTFMTFDGLRKRAHMERWLNGYLDERYGLVFVDEAQDFDPIMLDIVKRDTVAPKVFVGDPKQQIYEWRGTINAFEQLPDKTLVLEYYKTFRMGEPATSQIAQHTNTPMISGIPDTHSEFVNRVSSEQSFTTPYTYLFRSWKGLLTTSQTLANTLSSDIKFWVYDYDRQMSNIEKLHERMAKYGASTAMNDEYEDDLPSFLMKLNKEELQSMKDAIESRRVFQKARAHIKLYTIHSFKGMEDDVVRVCGDIDPTEESNLYYVATTRGRKQIYVDPMNSSLVKSNSNGNTHTISNNPTTITTRSDSSSSSTTPDFLNELKSFRYQHATSKNIPPYCVFPNNTMHNIVDACPQTTTELLTVRGIGKKKMEDYGEEILSICKRHKKNSGGGTEVAKCMNPSVLETCQSVQNTPPPTTPLLLCYYDIESTGLDTANDDVIQLSVQYVCSTLSLEHKQSIRTFTTFVKTDRPIPPNIQRITGITPTHIQTSPYAESVWATVQQHVYELSTSHRCKDIVWIAHNGNGFDHKMLQRDCHRYQLTMLQNRLDYKVWYVDTLPMAREVFTSCPMAPENNKLQTLYQWCYERRSKDHTLTNHTLTNQQPLQFHRADADVKAMVLVLDTMVELSPNVLNRHVASTLPLPGQGRSYNKRTKEETMQTELTTHQQQSVLRLMALRDQLGTQHQKTPVAVLSDTVLLQLALTRPSTMTDLRRVNGLTVQKIIQHGDTLLKAFATHELTTPSETEQQRTTSTYATVYKRHYRLVLREKGLTDRLDKRLAKYNDSCKPVAPFTASIVKSEHRAPCTHCQSMNHLCIGQLFFSGRISETQGYVKYCLSCVENII